LDEKMLATTLYFLLALFLLVLVHEYGHFQVARWCGVKVTRFSFGFGKMLLQWRDRKGTQYVLSLLPLGGYVKMLGESKEVISEKEKHMAFNNQSIWVRVAIVLAGPLFNFVFAFIALWLVLVIGMHSLAPIVQSVQPYSIAAQAGISANQELIGFNDIKINSWKDFQYALMPYIGSQENVTLHFKSIQDGHQSQLSLPLADWRLNDKNPDPIRSLGIIPFIPKIPPVVGEIMPHSPAAKTDLQPGDKLLRVNGIAIEDWIFFVEYVQARPEALLHVTIERGNHKKTILIKAGHQILGGKRLGFIGLHSKKVNWPSQWLRLEREGPIQSIKTALKQTFELSKSTFTLMGRLMLGKLSLKSISGPLGIAQGAGQSGRNGFVAYLFFLALISISLGAINLLPIPLLDGGHLLYYAVEMIRGKPLSEEVKSRGVYLGAVLLTALMCIAFTNDLSRLMS
jgi:regulator of sigma E protease